MARPPHASNSEANKPSWLASRPSEAPDGRRVLRTQVAGTGGDTAQRNRAGAGEVPHAGHRKARLHLHAVGQNMAVPARNAAEDFDSAVHLAAETDRKVLVIVGGEWCGWCHVLDAFWAENSTVGDAVRSTFVILKVNVSQDNRNRSFLSRFPPFTGAPHFFVVGDDGEILGSQRTGVLEQGAGYSEERFMAFVLEWKDWD